MDFSSKEVNSATLEVTVCNSYKYVGVSSTTLTVFAFALAVLSQLQDYACGYVSIFWRLQRVN